MSEDVLKLIKKEINKDEELEDKEINIIKFQFLKKSNVLKVVLRGKNSLNEVEEEKIKKAIKKIINVDIDIEILFYRDISTLSLKEAVENHWLEIVGDIIKTVPLSKPILVNGVKSVEGSNIVISSGYEKLNEHLRTKDVPGIISSNIRNIFDIKSNIIFKYDESLEKGDSNEEKLQKEKEVLKEIFSGRNIKSEVMSSNEKSEEKKSDKQSKQNKPY